MKRHSNLSIFVPHKGCPNKCLFCNQRRISGTVTEPTPEEVTSLCEEYLPRDGKDTEIAFFGGSFTAIDRAYMASLLAAAYKFVKAKRAKGIRISTRPDAIDGEILSVLSRYGVTAIELGAQSMDDEILRLNKRGHKADDIRKASALITSHGDFSLGLQMMVGMYGDESPEQTALMTAREFIKLSPETVRIYPTIVVEDTELCDLYRAGEYTPLTVENAAEITAKLLMLFEESGVNVIRVGLHSDESMTESAVAGPFHPAFGEICYSLVMRKRVEDALHGRTGAVEVRVNPKDVSKLLGQKRSNVEYFKSKGIELTVKPNDSIEANHIEI